MANNTTHTMLGHSAESNPEELLDVFKAAALSVTKLYKTSAAVQSKARVEGYQDCLEDLLAVLEKGDADVRTIRRWALERLDGREPILPTIESEDEVEKTDGSTPEPPSATANVDRQARAAGGSGATSAGNITANGNADTAMQTEPEAEAEMETEGETPTPSKTSRTTPASTTGALASTTKKTKSKARNAAASATANTADAAAEHTESGEVQPPSFDNFTFRSTVTYPTDSFLELANLDLSDRRSASGSVKDTPEPPSTAATGGATYVFNAPATQATSAAVDNASPSPSHTPGSRQFRVRHAAGRPGSRAPLTARYNRASAGQKRKLNFDEIFDLASLGYGKDVFGRSGGKRPRQT